MKKVMQRTTSLLVLVAVLLAGLTLYIIRYIKDGASWVSFSANRTAFTDGVLSVGRVTDRNGVILADIMDGKRTYADDETLRRAVLHAVGDASGNIGTGALSEFTTDLIGYNIVSGAYSIDGLGGTLSLSIDAELNRAAYEALDGRRGTVAVYNYETGEIVCMVSAPAYDPADPPEISDGDERYEGVYINRFLSSAYIPGSIFKLVTTAAAIENIDNLYDRFFTCEGSLTVGGDEITCLGTHGDIGIEEALAVSCNCAYAQIALELGADIIARYAEQYGLLSSVDVDGIATAAGNFDKAGKGTANLAWSGIGQYNDTVNPCAMLRFVGAIANGGEAADIKLKQKKGVLSFFPSGTQRIMETATAEALNDMMNYNVYYSYGTDNYPGLEMYAKSGTAEVGGGNSPHAWFVGYIKNENNPFAFVVIVENGGYGSTVGGAVANRVLQAVVEKD